MREKKTLVFLCTRTIASNILNGDLDILILFDLPHELFESLLTHLQPFALEKLHAAFDSLLQLKELLRFNLALTKHGNAICKILDQNKDTLSSLEFTRSMFMMDALYDICRSLCREHVGYSIMSLSIRYSCIIYGGCEDPTGFLTFISSGRSLCSLKISNSVLTPSFAKMILDTLIDSSSNISSLVISENRVRILGQLYIDTSVHSFPFSSRPITPLRSLKVLNLRRNNLRKGDVEYLKCALMCMPRLRSLDISDNPLGDDGARTLISCLGEQPKKFPVVELNLANCHLSSTGAIEILESLSYFSEPLKSLSIAQNNLGRCVALPLATLLSTGHIERLNIEDIGLGPCGFSEVEQAISNDLRLVDLKISQNRGGLETAILLSKIIAYSPDLAVVDAGYNLMPLESVTVIHAALKLSRGKLKRLDLTGNLQLGNHASIFDEFSYEGESIVVLSPSQTIVAPHDDDP